MPQISYEELSSFTERLRYIEDQYITDVSRGIAMAMGRQGSEEVKEWYDEVLELSPRAIRGVAASFDKLKGSFDYGSKLGPKFEAIARDLFGFASIRDNNPDWHPSQP